MDLHSLGIPQEPRQEAHRKSQNVFLQRPTVESDLPVHGAYIADMRYASDDMTKGIQRAI